MGAKRSARSTWSDRWRQWRWRKWRRRAPPPELSPQEGYRRWARSYGHEPNALQQLEAEALERLLPPLEGCTVLDVGCGKARVAARALELGARHAFATDFAFAMLSDPEAPKDERLHRFTADSSCLPVRNGSADVVICALMLGHLPTLGPPLHAMADALRPGGSLVLSDFHPFATLQGWERTFTDPESGDVYAIAQHLHLVSSYVAELGQKGLVIDALEEPLWQGKPVVLALRARKPG